MHRKCPGSVTDTARIGFFALTVDAKSFHFAEVFSRLAPNASVGSTVHRRFHWYTTHLSLFCCLALFLFFSVLFVLSVCFVRELRVCFSTWPNVFSVGLFVLALTMRIVMFASNVSALKEDGSLPFLMLCLSTATDETIDHIFVRKYSSSHPSVSSLSQRLSYSSSF